MKANSLSRIRFKRAVWVRNTNRMDVDVNKGGSQVEYKDQDPRIHEMFLDAMKKAGAESGMGQFIDES